MVYKYEYANELTALLEPFGELAKDHPERYRKNNGVIGDGFRCEKDGDSLKFYLKMGDIDLRLAVVRDGRLARRSIKHLSDDQLSGLREYIASESSSLNGHLS